MRLSSRLRKNPGWLRRMRPEPSREQHHSLFLTGWRTAIEVHCKQSRPLSRPFGSCHSFHEVAHPHQVVHGRGKGEQPLNHGSRTKLANKGNEMASMVGYMVTEPLENQHRPLLEITAETFRRPASETDGRR